MHITDFKLEDDNTYWEAFASHKNNDPFTIKVRVITTRVDYLIVVRDYKTGILIDEKRCSPYFLPNTVKLSATRFAKKCLGEM